jgi:hypothetical protein
MEFDDNLRQHSLSSYLIRPLLKKLVLIILMVLSFRPGFIATPTHSARSTGNRRALLEKEGKIIGYKFGTGGFPACILCTS